MSRHTAAVAAKAGGVRLPDGYGPPLVIAGIGGSATRVAAGMLDELGFFLGEDLNDALDNLSYTLLLKRPRWYMRASTRQRRVDAALRPLLRSLTTGGRPALRERLTLAGAVIGTVPRGNDRLGRRRGLKWAPGAARRVARSSGHDPTLTPGWGFKEPNAIVLLPELITALPELRFLHVVRDPEQVARGKNQTMVYNWSENLGLRPPSAQDDLVERSLEFGRVLTERTERIGRERLGERYHQLDINRLTEHPDEQIDPLLAFLGSEPDADTRARLAAIPQPQRLSAAR
jgi:hypothetical protein